MPSRLGSSQKRICLNQWILRLPSITELLSHTLSKYDTWSQTFIWNRSSTQKLDLVHFLLKFGCPVQMGNNFYSPPVIFIMFKSFLITKMHIKTISDFWWYSKILTLIFFSKNLVFHDNWANIFDSPLVTFIMFKSFLITKMHLKTTGFLIVFKSIVTYFSAIVST